MDSSNRQASALLQSAARGYRDSQRSRQAFSGSLADSVHESLRVGTLNNQNRSLDDILKFWFCSDPGRTLEQLIEEIERCLVEIDQLIEAQLNAILHHPRFQKLEGTWRGVAYLLEQTPIPERKQDWAKVPVRILLYHITWDELTDDVTESIEFDRSHLFRNVYTENYGMAGGEPIGLLIGDYELEPNQTTCEVLTAVSGVAAAAFCPFITGVSARFWGVDSFTELQYTDLVRMVTHPPRIAPVTWEQFRRHEDSRFIGLAIPRILLRRPYHNQQYNWLRPGQTDLLRFEEETGSPDLTGYVWGSAAWAFGEVAIREFLHTRWFGEMLAVEVLPRERGRSQPELIPHGMVVGLPELSFSSYPDGLQPKPSTDLYIDETLEQLFIEQGFLTLARCPGGPFSAFYAAPSVQISRVYDRKQATENAKLSATLDAMLCVSRFAHYLKHLGRNWLGTSASADEIEVRLHNWLMEYVSADTSIETSREARAERPLTDAAVKVVAHPGKHGAFKCQIHLRPRLTPDGLVASIRLMTEFVSPDAAASEI